MSLEDYDAYYLSYPLHHRIAATPESEVAFANSKLSAAMNRSLMHMFVRGEQYERITRFMMSKGDVLDPNAPEELSAAQISIQSVRSIFSNWRERVFLKEKFLDAILHDLMFGARSVRSGLYDCEKMRTFILECCHGLNSSGEEERLSEDNIVNFMGCLKNCPAGLTIRDHKAKHSSYTNLQDSMIVWRTFLDIEKDRELFEEWKKDRVPKLSIRGFGVYDEMLKRHHCHSCKLDIINSLEVRMLQNFLEYIGRFRPRSAKESFLIIVSAFIYGVIKSDLMASIDDLYVKAKISATSPLDVSDDLQDLAFGAYQRDQDLINVVANDIICALVALEISRK